MKFLNLIKKPVNTYRMYKTVRAENPNMSRRQALEAVDYKLDPTRVSVYEDAMYGVDKVGFKGYTEEEIKQIQSTPEGREKLNKTYEDQQEMLSRMKKNVATIAVVATQSPTVKENKKVLATKYKPFNKDLIKNLTDILNTLPWSAARNELISKIEMMDVAKLNELYWEKPDLFNVYFAYDSDAYTDGLEYEGEHEELGGFGDLIDAYEARYGEI